MAEDAEAPTEERWPVDRIIWLALGLALLGLTVWLLRWAPPPNGAWALLTGPAGWTCLVFQSVCGPQQEDHGW